MHATANDPVSPGWQSATQEPPSGTLPHESGQLPPSTAAVGLPRQTLAGLTAAQAGGTNRHRQTHPTQMFAGLKRSIKCVSVPVREGLSSSRSLARLLTIRDAATSERPVAAASHTARCRRRRESRKPWIAGGPAGVDTAPGRAAAPAACVKWAAARREAGARCSSNSSSIVRRILQSSVLCRQRVSFQPHSCCSADTRQITHNHGSTAAARRKVQLALLALDLAAAKWPGSGAGKRVGR